MYPDVKPALGAAEKFLSQIAIKGDQADAYMRLVSIETRQILEHWRWLVEKLVVELLKCRKMTGADLTGC
jgi:hypothetical protein